MQLYFFSAEEVTIKSCLFLCNFVFSSFLRIKTKLVSYFTGTAFAAYGLYEEPNNAQFGDQKALERSKIIGSIRERVLRVL